MSVKGSGLASSGAAFSGGKQAKLLALAKLPFRFKIMKILHLHEDEGLILFGLVFTHYGLIVINDARFVIDKDSRYSI